MTVLIGEPALRMLHVPVAPRNSSAGTLGVIDSVFTPTTCRALIDEADRDRWLTTTAEIARAANGPYTHPPQRVNEHDRPCRLVGNERDGSPRDHSRPRFAILDAPVLALRLFYRLVEQLPDTRDGAELAAIKPLLRCVEYRRGEGTQPHRDPIRETADGLRSAMSILVFLNEQFEGGGIEFPELGRVIEAKAGRALVFPHSLMHVDQIVEHGRKFVLETDVFYSPRWQPYQR
jgi:hypothetical protein